MNFRLNFLEQCKLFSVIGITCMLIGRFVDIQTLMECDSELNVKVSLTVISDTLYLLDVSHLRPMY